MLEKLLDCTGFAIDVETTSESGKKKDNLHFKKNEIVCISFANDEVSFCLTEEEILQELDMFIELLEEKKLIGHNLKFDAKCLARYTSKANLYYDTHIASCLMNENEKHDLKSLCKKYLKEEWGEYQDQESIDQLKEYCRLDALNTWKLAKYQKKRLEQQRLWDLFKLEMEVLSVFYRAELRGVPVDIPYLTGLKSKYERYVGKVKKWIYAHTQEEFNINSSQQLCDVLYAKKKLPILKKTAKGSASTDTRTLKLLSKDGHRFVDSILLYRHWEMLIRHIEKLIKEAIDGKIYPNFNTVGTETGRFSCSSPNLQQIPSKTTESRKIRKAIKGRLTVADYSNVELRLLAHYSRDPRLIKVYKENGDLHEQTAQLLGITRAQAKTINFGISYGMGPKKLAEDLDISDELATEYINKWYETYNYVRKWKTSVINTAKKYGFVRSIGGRKRRINFDKLKFNEQWKAEREIVNFVIQGSSADITKMAIAALKDEDIRMQVHDEIVIYNAIRPIEEIKSIMENVVELKIPLDVEIKSLSDWGSMK